MADRPKVRIQRLVDENDVSLLSHDLARWIYLSANEKLHCLHGNEAIARERLQRFVNNKHSVFSGFNASVAFVDSVPAGTAIAVEGNRITECLRADFFEIARQTKREERATLAARLAELHQASPPIAADTYFLAALAVDPAYRGLGIGRQLLVDLMEHARKSGHRKVRLDARADNQVALRLYDSCGFKKISEKQIGFLGASIVALLLEL
jgi:ribosomal protein S18 acetylase RimI-like enzyme